MYSFEIQNKMEEYNYDIPSNVMADIIHTSPQIARNKYNPFAGDFEMWTYDECYWKYRVHPGT